ncbi:2-methylcitrate dehydratase [Aliidongia dinghuensis]|uniref:2-methylcitrate dehydratase n=1 Tax=Aliidongia dinghuensis TaxID=1867774 RepID=A0A8J3E6R2_9PROT|nr:MmgE/PrpD family protein [Aliidongia dinghuensis]GGF47238.1 2-methylcitrate dehydratase [Aliidongia dinghuensis]
MTGRAQAPMATVCHLAAYVAAARARALGAEEREAACRSLLDLVAAAAAGLDAPGPRAVRATASAVFAGGDHPIWFSGRRTGLAGAVWCNSAAAAALDLDDGHRLARGHPGAAVIPVAVAGAEGVGAATDDLLKAIAVGYQVGVAIGASRRFYANTGMWSGYGVVAALGLLRGTPEAALAHAFAIAGVSAPNQLHAGGGPVFPAQEGSDVKEGIPWSNVTAINALLLAEAGHTGPLGLLDVTEHFAPETLLAGLAGPPAITRSYVKFHACCRHVHAPVEALLGLIERHGLDPRAIDAVEVETYSGALRIANRAEPQGFTDMQFSIPYCLGLVALDGAEALLPLRADAVGRPEVAAFARKVSLRLDRALDARFPAETLARVSVMAGGRRFVSPETAPRGEASDPPSWDGLEEKLRRATRFVASAAEQDALLSAVRALRGGDHRPLLRVFADVRLGRNRASEA